MIGCFMSTMYNLLHIPLCTVMLILIFNSTAYCHAHSFTFYILFFISYFSFILSYVYFPCVVFSIFALSMERTRLSFHCWLYSLCIVVYVTNKTWNLKLENLKLETLWIIVIFLSALWTLFLTAPIHCRGSIGEKVMQFYIPPNLFWWRNKLYVLDLIFKFMWTIPFFQLCITQE